jgi:hypothetical protein
MRICCIRRLEQGSDISIRLVRHLLGSGGRLQYRILDRPALIRDRSFKLAHRSRSRVIATGVTACREQASLKLTKLDQWGGAAAWRCLGRVRLPPQRIQHVPRSPVDNAYGVEERMIVASTLVDVTVRRARRVRTACQ